MKTAALFLIALSLTNAAHAKGGSGGHASSKGATHVAVAHTASTPHTVRTASVKAPAVHTVKVRTR